MSNHRFKEYVGRVKALVNIFDVVSQHVELTPAGKGICPFHDDHSPSFFVNVEGQYFYCFGCGDLPPQK